jgi:hypothetical protein
VKGRPFFKQLALSTLAAVRVAVANGSSAAKAVARSSALSGESETNYQGVSANLFTRKSKKARTAGDKCLRDV